MVLKRAIVLVLALGCMVACERIPERERQALGTMRMDDVQRLVALKKWIWTCRAEAYSNASLGKAIEEFQDFFRQKNFSVLDSSSGKTTLGSALLWNAQGYIVLLDRGQNLKSGIECSNGQTPWMNATLMGQDSSLGISVIKVDLQNFPKQDMWLMGEDAPEGLQILSSAVAGHLDQIALPPQSLESGLRTGLDEDLLIFLPPPPLVSTGGLMVDARYRVLGLVLLPEGSAWGVGLKIRSLDRIVEQLIKTGKVLRPYLGFKMRFVSPQGFTVQQVDLQGPAHESGMRIDDVLLSFDGRNLRAPSDWIDLTKDSVGRSVSVVYKRGDKTIEARLVVRKTE